MTDDYQTLKIFLGTDTKIEELLKSEENYQKILISLHEEIGAFRRAMAALPTSREKDALPHLRVLKTLSNNLVTDRNHVINNIIQNNQTLKNYLVNDFLNFVSKEIIRTRVYNDKEIVRVADSIFMNLITWGTRLIYKKDVQILELINTIINSSAEYYKTNGIESIHLYPFGRELQPDESHKEWIDSLEIGTKVDFLYSASNRKNWCVGEIIDKDWNSIKVRCVNDINFSYISNKYFEILPLNSRKKEYEWREKIQIGDFVDYYDYKDDWKAYKVIEINEDTNSNNEKMKKIKIEEIIPSSENEKKFVIINVLSPKLENFQKYSGDNFETEDAQDENYLATQKTTQFAIMRADTMYKGTSTYLVKYINIFGEEGGFDYFLKIINQEIEVSSEVLENMIRLFKSCCRNLVKPFIEKNGKLIYGFLKNYLLTNMKLNLRNFDQKNMTNVINTLSSLGERIYLKKQAKKMTQEIEVNLAILCLKSEFLEKQFYGAKLLNVIDSQTKNVFSDITRKELAEIISKEKVFETIIKAHPSLIAKANGVFKLLFSESVVNEEQLDLLWNQIIKTDLESRTALLALIKDILFDFSQKEIIFFIDRMIIHAEEIVNSELFELIYSLKKVGWNKYGDNTFVEKVGKVLWGILENEKDLKKELVREVIKNFIKFVEEHKNFDYIRLSFENIKNDKNVIRNIKIIEKLLKCDYETTKAVINLIKEKDLLKKIIEKIYVLLENKMKNNLFNMEEKGTIELKRYMKFISTIVKESLNENLLHFQDIKQIWNIVFRANINEPFIFNFFKEFVLEKENENYLEDFIQFLDENLDKYMLDENSNNNECFFDLLIEIFYKINISKNNFAYKRVKFEMENDFSTKNNYKNIYYLANYLNNFVCFEKILKMYLFTKNEKLEQKLAHFISELYTTPLYIQIEKSQFYDFEKKFILEKCEKMITSEEVDQIRKGCILLKILIKREEIDSKKCLRSYMELNDFPKILLSVKKNSFYAKEKFTLSLSQNKTLLHLKKKVGQFYNMKLESVDIFKIENVNNNEKKTRISNLENSTTLKELEIDDKTILEVSEQETPETEEYPLINETCTGFTEKTKNVFSEIFSSYSKDNKMSRRDLANFTSKATDGMICTENDDRIIYVFNNYDNDKKNYLTEEEFLTFYWSCASKDSLKLSTVKNNLKSLGYGKDLRLKHKNDQKSGDNSENYLRYQISQNSQFFNKLLFYLGEEKFRSKELIDFLYFLTPNKDYVANLFLNPLEAFSRSKNNHLLWNFDLVLIYALIFKNKAFSDILGSVMNKDSHKNIILKIFSSDFVNHILNFIKEIPENDDISISILSHAYKFLEHIIQISISFKEKEFIEDTTNFIAYRLKEKKKKNKEKNNEKNNEKNAASTSTEQNKEKENKEKENFENNYKYIFQIRDLIESEANYISAFLSQLECEKLNEITINKLNDFIKRKLDSISGEKRNLLKSYIVVLLGSLLNKPDQMEKLLNEENSVFKKILFTGLTHKIIICQFYFKSFYGYLTANIGNLELKTIFLGIIIKSIEESQDNEEIHVLVELANNLLNEVGIIEKDSVLTKKFNFLNLFINFIERLQNHQSKEIDFNSENDNSLVSIISFLEKLIECNPSILEEYPNEKKRELISYLFKNCLFSLTQDGIELFKVKCKCGLSRSHALNLLYQVVKNDQRSLIYLIIIGYKPLIKYIPVSKTEHKQPVRTKFDFIGIQNPGCVCYMNAMLQQFYCTPPFRYGILLADDGQDKVDYQMKEEIIDDNVFHQLQKMFAYLDISQRGDFSPLAFCSTYKDFTGQRTNLMVQQDAQEFLNVIFDKLENSLKTTPFKGILDSVFAGKTANLFTCKNCGFVRSNEELFYNLSLPVKNMNDLNESFEKFINQEIISDFNCDNCKQKCDIIKQCFLKDLPNVLIIHLQKISFDLEELRNVKYTSKYKFEKTLNMKKFVLQEKKAETENEEEKIEGEEELEQRMTEENKDSDDTNFEYKLVGVVIHTGNAEYGHYTSLINVNRNDPNRKNIKEDLWLEFDDSRISKYNMENFDGDCFGTIKESEFSGSYLMDVDLKISKSAYILVYDKIKSSNLKFHFNENNLSETTKITDNLQDLGDFKLENNDLEIPYNNLNKYIPGDYEKIINEDNNNLILENQLHSANFSNTFLDMLFNSGLPTLSINNPVDYQATSYDKTLSDALLQIIPDYLLKIFTVSKINFKINQLISVLESCLIISDHRIEDFFLNVIKGNISFIISVIINHNETAVRFSFMNLVVKVATLYIRKFKIQISFDQNKSYQELNDDEKKVYIFKQVLDFILMNLPNKQNQQKLYKKMTNYFEMIKSLLENNPIILDYFLQINMLNKFYEIYMTTSKEVDSNSHEYCLTHILTIIGLILNNLRLAINNVNNQSKSNMVNYFNYYASLNFIKKINKEDYLFDMYKGLHLIINVICYKNLDLSIKIALESLKELQYSRDSSCVSYLETLSSLMSINDEFKNLRWKMILGSPQLCDNQSEKNDKISFDYGLSKELNLKSQKYVYPTTFGFEKSLLDILFNSIDMSEVKALLIIFYLLVYMDLYPYVLDYIINLPSYNYFYSSIFNWFRDFIDYQLKTLSSSYNPPKAELFYFYFNKLPEAVNTFEKNVKKYLMDKRNFSEEKAQKYQIFNDKEELININPNYMIGRTISTKVKKIYVLDADEYGEFSLRIDLIKVRMISLKTDGVHNLTFTKNFLSFKSYINVESLTGELRDFLEADEQKKYPDFNENEMDVDLVPLGGNEDIETKNDTTKNNAIDEEEGNVEEDESQSEQEDSNDNQKIYLDKNYILRISANNNCYKNYFLEVSIRSDGDDPNYETGSWTRLIQFNKKMLLMKNLTLKNLDKGFENLKVYARFYQSEKNDFQFFEETELNDKILVFDQSGTL